MPRTTWQIMDDDDIEVGERVGWVLAMEVSCRGALMPWLIAVRALETLEGEPT